MRRSWALLLAALALLAAGTAGAEPENLNPVCAFRTLDGGKLKAEAFTDGDYKTYVKLSGGKGILADGKGAALGSVLLQFYDRPTAVEVWAETAEGWTLAGTRGAHLSDWVALPEGTTALRVVNTDRARLFLAELTVFAPGERPDKSPEWVDLDKADLMAAVCHPDDELLWFGGLLPTYAGERGLRVQVVYAVPSTPERRLELLDGLWHCGVKAYPSFLGLADNYTKTARQAWDKWGKNRMEKLYVEQLRRYKPEVLVTHDFKGEYGHGGHQAVAGSATKAVKAAADRRKYAALRKRYGVWQVKKCYVHLYDQNTVVLDWHVPLDAFGGKDGLTVAEEALALHRSQTSRGWKMEDGGECDNSRFGLWFTAVGKDEAGDDLFEHIKLDGN